MLFVHPSLRNRRAFTLIELLTVVVIIGILAGLVTAAAIRVRSSVRKATHAIELKELEMALQAYKERFGDFPPDFLPAGGFTPRQLFDRHIRKAFPRCPAVTIDAIWSTVGQHQTPETALSFWLGGVNASGDFNGNGFSANPMHPFDSSASRIGPFYDFDSERLSADRRYYYPTVDSLQTNETKRAIRYYRAHTGSPGNEYDHSPVAFKDSRTNGWVNPRSFQILSPGLALLPVAQVFVPDHPMFPAGPYTEAQLEMMSNFTGGTMEDAMP